MDNYLKQIFLTLFNFSFKRLSRSKFKLNELLVDIKFSFNFKFYLNLLGFGPNPQLKLDIIVKIIYKY